jgi:4-hydroxy-tetrahydrodipicolinate synthase
MTTSPDQLRDALATVVVVPVTPFDEDGNPDLDTYATLAGRLVDSGITVITPNGNTGEFYALTQAEARQITEAAVKVADGRAQVLAGVGHDVATATEAARHAERAGASMIMIHQPVHRRGALPAQRADHRGLDLGSGRPRAERDRCQIRAA